MIQTLQHSPEKLDSLMLVPKPLPRQKEVLFLEPRLDFAIREHLIRQLKHEISCSDFYDWFSSETRDVYEVASPALIDLIGEIELSLAEFSHGDWTEGELQDIFRGLLEEHVLGSFRKRVRYATSTWGAGDLIPINSGTPCADKRHAVAYA